ncbi:hypothetical protein VNO77_19933 [Canavalia gladiata]|uniref:Uncharacterized protein n=1 Tax=Canavalia gladiata TaxID=3824 RepID=A0AAN9QLX4_CANGL
MLRLVEDTARRPLSISLEEADHAHPELEYTERQHRDSPTENDSPYILPLEAYERRRQRSMGRDLQKASLWMRVYCLFFHDLKRGSLEGKDQPLGGLCPMHEEGHAKQGRLQCTQGAH